MKETSSECVQFCWFYEQLPSHVMAVAVLIEVWSAGAGVGGAGLCSGCRRVAAVALSTPCVAPVLESNAWQKTSTRAVEWN